MFRTRIAGTGSYLPEKVLTNTDLEKLVDTNDQWIRERTGIERRHIAAQFAEVKRNLQKACLFTSRESSEGDRIA